MADVMDFNKECCLCLRIFTDPRVLPCLHTFCLKCLENMGSPIPNDWLLCPVCGSKFNVPEEGITGLPKNIFVEKSTDVRTIFKFTSADDRSCDACAKGNMVNKNAAEKYCINCEETLCLKCCEKHNEEKEHLVVDLVSRTATKAEGEEPCRCRVHNRETPTLFCIFCKRIICDKCFQESHSSHSCSDFTDVVNFVCKQADKEYNEVEKMQHRFQDNRETLHREQMKFLERVKRMETEVLQRCEELKKLVVTETKALLQELVALKKERLEEIEMEHRRLDKHLFTLEKFKEYCACVKNNDALNYTCEAECILRHTADELRIREKSRIENRVFPLEVELQKTEIPELLVPISSAIGKLKMTYPCKMDLPITINTGERSVHGMASLQDKLYLLSDSILIHRAEDPYDCVGEIKTPEIKSPVSIVSCCQTSRLYIHDKENACIWSVSVSDHQVTRWFDKVKEPCAMSVTPNGEVLMIIQSTDTRPITVEIYNEKAMLTERVELPKSIKKFMRIYKTPSGYYIGFSEQNVYKFRADGSTVCRFNITDYPDVGCSVRCLALAAYHVLLISRTSLDQWGLNVSLITSDLAFHRSLLCKKEKVPISACHVKATKRLAVLEKVPIGSKAKTIVTVYVL